MKNIIIVILFILLCCQYAAYASLHSDHMHLLQAIEENIL